MTTIITRSDARFVSSEDPRAVLVARGGPDLTLDMGGWLDGSLSEFEGAVRDEVRYGLGLSDDEVAAFRVSITTSDAVLQLVEAAVDGMTDNDLMNGLGGDYSVWTPELALETYADDAFELLTGPQFARAEDRIQRWLDKKTAAKRPPLDITASDFG